MVQKQKFNKMRTIQIVIFIVVTIFLSCSNNRQSSDQFAEEQEKSLGREDFGNAQNPLYGKIYSGIRDITEDIPELKRGSDDYCGEKIILASEDNNGNYKHGISYFADEKGNIVCIFNEYQISENGLPAKILDTIHIGKLKDREYLFLNCTQDETIWDSEIIAVAILEKGKDFYDVLFFEKIVKAWRADTKTGRIKPIENLKGLVGINDEAGL